MAQKKPLKDKVDKRRRARINIGVDAVGNKVSVWISAHNDAELSNEKKDLQNRYKNGAEDAGDLTVGDYIKRWYIAYKVPVLRPNPLRTLRSLLNVHVLPPLGARFIRSVLPHELQEILNIMAKKGLSHSAIKEVYNYVRAIFRQASIDRFIEYDSSAALVMPRTAPPKKRRALTDAEVNATLSFANESASFGLFMLIPYYTGLRRGEVAALSWGTDKIAGDIMWDDGMIYVQNALDFSIHSLGLPKSYAAERYVPILPPLMTALKQARGIGPIFPGVGGGLLSESVYKRRWTNFAIDLVGYSAAADAMIETKFVTVGPSKINTKYKTDASMRPGPKPREKEEVEASILTAHYYRHHYATALYYAGVPLPQAAQWFGHSDISTLLRIYTHLAKLPRQQNATHLSRILAAEWEQFKSATFV